MYGPADSTRYVVYVTSTVIESTPSEVDGVTNLEGL
jgi:hypothetical protein